MSANDDDAESTGAPIDRTPELIFTISTRGLWNDR
jgi:hypothetical protein